MSDVLRGLAEVQSTMLITDPNRDKIIRSMSELKKLQAENAELTKREQHYKSGLKILREVYPTPAIINYVDDLLKGDSDE